MDIKPIETVYNGYRFRSRLEARVAVLFDRLSVRYEYEPEGFSLTDGSKYLPDFYLSDERIFAEVKAIRPNIENELEKVVRFVRETGESVLIISCIPNPDKVKIWWYPIIWYNALMDEITISRIGLSVYGDEKRIGYLIRTHGVTYEPKNVALMNCEYDFLERFRRRRENIMMPKADAWMYRDVNEVFHPQSGMDDDTLDFISEAYTSARQARFEHGETPAGGIR